MPDYSKYYFSRKEWLMCFAIAGAGTGMIAWLFYRSVYAVILFPLCLKITKRQLKKYWEKKRVQEMLRQFQEMLQIIAGLLKAGCSMENAFREGERDFVGLYGKESIMAREFAVINHQLRMNIPIEKLLEDLAERSGIEEIESFSQVFGFAKRGGGDIVKIFRDSTERIAERAEVQREIETLISGKKLEQKIMALVPCGILIYIGVGMPEFLDPLYGNLPGVLIMSVCLAVYGAACLMAQKIVEIQR